VIHLPNITEQFAVLGTIITAMGCATCFPALGVLAASLGLGFLSAHEGILINKLLPIFAVAALIINLYYWWQHRVHWRGVLSLLGPTAVLLALYPLWNYDWSTQLFYAALALMFLVSVLDLVKPPRPPECLL